MGKNTMLRLVCTSTVLLAFIGFLLSILSILNHPLIGDDIHFFWSLKEHGSLKLFLANHYDKWGGNIFHILIWYFFSYSSINLFIYKLTLVPIFLLMSILAYYLATNRLPQLGTSYFRNFVIFTSILWLAIPEIGQTIAWATGSVYLYMTFFMLILLSLLSYAKQKILLGHNLNCGFGSGILIFIISLLLGTSSIQVFCSVIFLSLVWLFDLNRKGLIKEVPIIFYLSLLSFLLGFIILISAPGNFERLSSYEDPQLLSRILKFLMYIAGAYFSGGSGNLGIGLIFGSIILMLSGPIKKISDITNGSLVWFAASLISLLPMILAVDFTSPRTTFMATIFLLIGIKSLVIDDNDEKKSYISPIDFIPAMCCLLVIVDSFIGWAANRSLAAEVENRMQIIELSSQRKVDNIIVPHFTTIPSRQTYMLRPNYDKDFLDSMARYYGISSIKHDSSENAPQPNTLHPLKAMRESL